MQSDRKLPKSLVPLALTVSTLACGVALFPAGSFSLDLSPLHRTSSFGVRSTPPPSAVELHELRRAPRPHHASHVAI